MRRTKAKRLLATETQLSKLEMLLEMGVALNRAIRQEQLPGTALVYRKLLEHYTLFKETNDPAIHASLFPPWLPDEQPDDAVYNGYFPLGFWSYENN
jgi:hypothetical protein